ncbi:MAG: cell envelope integrity protein TolA [Lysobacterales bacterium]|jgi:colicin import membrane protein
MPRIILRPALATTLLHGVLLYLLTANWSLDDREVVRVKPVPKVINARLVDASEFRPKPKPKPQPKPAPVARKPQPQPQPKPKPEAKKPPPKPEPVARPKPQPAPKPEPKVEPRITREELARIAQQELASVAAAEDQAAVGNMSASFIALIQATVVNYWSRPPSARNGMEAELAIQLIPTGEVVSVTVIRSSGNPAFDRSAVNAVEKAGAFPELQKLPSSEFEKTFRRFRLLFKPEDLRY